MRYAEGQERLAALREQIARMRAQMQAVRAQLEPQPVSDYIFKSTDGERRLTELFAGKQHLFIVHNMGSSCAYCTLWADGYNGIYEHLAQRAAFVVSSPELPAIQRKLAAARSWRFPMVSHDGTTFAADMGYRTAHGLLPGISAFELRGGRPVRVGDAEANVGDDFCSLWHIVDLLPHGARDWQRALDERRVAQPAPPSRPACCALHC